MRSFVCTQGKVCSGMAGTDFELGAEIVRDWSEGDCLLLRYEWQAAWCFVVSVVVGEFQK